MMKNETSKNETRKKEQKISNTPAISRKQNCQGGEEEMTEETKAIKETENHKNLLRPKAGRWTSTRSA